MTSPEPERAAGVTAADPTGVGLTASPRAEAVIDLDAISVNVARLRDYVGGRDLMAVVKADAYGHGIVAAARAARAGGAGWLGVALLDEALTLRSAGDIGPILSWLAVPGERYDTGITAEVDLTAYTAQQVEDIAAAARQLGLRARLQLKLDSGLGRGGAHPDQWPLLVDAAHQRQRSGDVVVTGIWSHLACSDEPFHPSNRAQLEQFTAGVAYARDAGLDAEHVHLANSGGALAIPEAWFTMIRPGIAVYGVSPFTDGTAPIELKPAMSLRATLALVKRVQAGHGVSYGHTYRTERATTLGLVPIGYGDGVPRHASGRGPALVGGHVFRVAGRVCMDQFVLDLGDLDASAGDPVVLFGDARLGEPTAHDWAAASDTIGYEIVTRIGSRVPRRYVGGDRVSSEGTLRRYAGLAGAAVGVVAAGAAVGILANRRRRAGHVAGESVALGTLRGDRHTATAADGLELYVEVDEADADGAARPTVVFVHGYALNLDSWHFQRAALRGRQRLVFYDQRSHGRSARSRSEHATIDQLGDDLVHVLDQVVGDGPVVLVGHSMGGMTVMALAEQFPELFGSRVVAVCLISTSSEGFTAESFGLPGAPGRLLHRLAPSVVATIARTPRLVETGRRASLGVAYVLTRRLAFGGPVPQEYVDFTDQMLGATPFGVVADFFPAFQIHDKASALKALDATKSLVVCGTKDAITPVGHSQHIAELIPDARLVEIEGAGHMVILEAHTEVTEAIESLLDEVDPA